MTTLSKRVGVGAAWNVLNIFVNRGGTAIVMMGLASYVGPRAFGLFSVIAVLREVALAVTNAGMSQAVVREPEVTEEGLSSVFWVNMAIAVALYGLLVLAAPLIADIYGSQQLVAMLRVACLMFLFGGFNIIHIAVLSRRLDFRSQTFAQTVSTVVSGILAVGTAYDGWGIWSLVVLLLSHSAVTSLMLWYYSRWVPRLYFSWPAFRPYWHFGKNLLLANIIGRLSDNSYVLVLGGVFTTQIAGLYYFAQKVKQVTGQMLSNAINQAGYPALAKFQHDNGALRQRYRRILRIQMFVIAPATLIAGNLATIGVPLVMGHDWANAVIYVQLLMIVAVVFPINAININAMSVKGRSDFILKLGLLKNAVRLTLLFATLPFGVLAIVWGQVGFSVLAWPLHAWVNHRLIGYGLGCQAEDVWKPLIAAMLVSASVLAAHAYYDPELTVLNLFWFTAGSGIAYLVLCQLLRESTMQWLGPKAILRLRQLRHAR